MRRVASAISSATSAALPRRLGSLPPFHGLPLFGAAPRLAAPSPWSTRAYSFSRALRASGGEVLDESAAATGGAAAKPRATGGSITSKRKRHYYLAALLGGPLVFVGYLAYSESLRRSR